MAGAGSDVAAVDGDGLAGDEGGVGGAEQQGGADPVGDPAEALDQLAAA
ncbi:hypothetical protein [Frankia sp. AgB32]|nr:hypothetical protein [Frankia sp. AgB32]MCK9896158.1 hypothetical protein [Frankia sp. AgB32]